MRQVIEIEVVVFTDGHQRTSLNENIHLYHSVYSVITSAGKHRPEEELSIIFILRDIIFSREKIFLGRESGIW